MKILLLTLASIAISVAAQFTLKAGMQGQQGEQGMDWIRIATSPHIIGGFALYGLGAVLWLYVLSRWDVSKAYPMVGLGFVLTLIVGHFAGESIGALRLVGVGLICVGVALVSQS